MSKFKLSLQPRPKEEIEKALEPTFIKKETIDKLLEAGIMRVVKEDDFEVKAIPVEETLAPSAVPLRGTAPLPKEELVKSQFKERILVKFLNNLPLTIEEQDFFVQLIKENNVAKNQTT